MRPPPICGYLEEMTPPAITLCNSYRVDQIVIVRRVSPALHADR